MIGGYGYGYALYKWWISAMLNPKLQMLHIISFIFSSCPQLHPWQKQSETKLTSRLCLSVCSTFCPRALSKFTGTYSPRKAYRMLLTKRSQLGFEQVRLLYKRHRIECDITSVHATGFSKRKLQAAGCAHHQRWAGKLQAHSLEHPRVNPCGQTRERSWLHHMS